jgi:alpha-tubulin suppressor-like RCC1 family protein
MNSTGQIGDGTTTPRPNPIKIMDDVKSISGSHWHTMALKTDGSLWAWGENPRGVLGDGTTTTHLSPIQVMDNVASFSTSNQNTMVIKTDGSLWAWGNNEFGQLGDGTRTDRLTPVKIMDDVISVSASSGDSIYHWDETKARTFAIKSDGTLWAWGNNDFGQLGDGTEIDRTTPVIIGANVLAVCTGENRTLAVTSDGSLWVWGEFDYRKSYPPTVIMDDVIAISASGHYSLALRSDGSLWEIYIAFWSATIESRHVMDDVTAISAFDSQYMAVKDDGSLWVWGHGYCSQDDCGPGYCCSGTYDPEHIMDNVVKVSTGYSHYLAITSDGGLWAWGRGFFIDGSEGNRMVPRKILDDVAAISVGALNSLVVMYDGTLWAFGDNRYGQMGDGTFTIVNQTMEELDEMPSIRIVMDIIDDNNRYSPVKIMDNVMLPGRVT